MNKVLILFLFLGSLPAFASSIPSNESNLFNTGTDFKVFVKGKKLSLLSEFSYLSRDKQDNYKHYLIGPRYKISPQFQVGLFYKRAYGLRHNEDWCIETGRWEWKNTSKRGENIYFLEGTYRTLIPIELPSVFYFRTRLFHNSFNSNKSLELKPSIGWFFNKKWAAFTGVDLVYAMNFGDTPISETWTYFSLLHSANKRMKFGPFLTYGKMFWTQSDFFKNRTGREFENSFTILKMGLNFNFYF